MTQPTSTQTQDLLNIYNGFQANAPPEILSVINSASAEFAATFDASKVIQPGEVLPSFELPDALGKTVSLKDLLEGPGVKGVLVTFYRGGWCPFCNIALHYLQKSLGEFEKRGVKVVAISPELPDTSLSTVEKSQLEFTVLSDVGNVFAGQLNILFHQPPSMKTLFAKLGESHDLQKRNGDDSYVVPVPVTLLVDAKGVVRNIWVEEKADYTKRLEPATALEWIDEMATKDGDA